MADARQALDKLLGELGESTQFATSGSLTPVLPGLEVRGVGPIGCPVAAADAKRLIAKASVLCENYSPAQMESWGSGMTCSASSTPGLSTCKSQEWENPGPTPIT